METSNWSILGGKENFRCNGENVLIENQINNKNILLDQYWKIKAREANEIRYPDKETYKAKANRIRYPNNPQLRIRNL